MKLWCTFVILTALATSKSFATDTPEVFLPDLGSVVGVVDKTLWTNQSFYSYRSIPYAESPSGELRFQPPKSRSAWNKTFDARNFGIMCPSMEDLSTYNETQLQEDFEDCLSINVYTKNLKAQLPVMFYICGGAFGFAYAALYRPHYLMEKDIVVVVPQYRVGALGFLTTLTDEMPGNVPIMDMQLSLDWVQKYIHLFGGDPTKVTLFGQSAGAAMLTSVLASPKTKPAYFKNAIVQSGSVLAPWCVQRNPLALVKRFCVALACTNCDSKSGINECLRNVHPFEVVKAQKKIKFSPVIGDIHGVLPDEPKTLLANLNRTIPSMTGFTKHDGSFLLAESYDTLVEQYGSISNVTVREFANLLIAESKDNTGLAYNLLLHNLFKPEILDTNNHSEAWLAYFDIANDVNFKSPAIAYANAMHRKGYPVYLYAFDYAGEYTRFMNGDRYPFEGGVHHGDENIYIFNYYSLNSVDTAFAKRMVNLWYSFAVEGEPKVADQPQLIIKPMNGNAGPYFHLNKDITFGNDVLVELTSTLNDPDSYKLIKSAKSNAGSGVEGLFVIDSIKYFILTLLSIPILIHTYLIL
ncbi:cocaine esterase-like [Eurosta solidaginis]|uniref:cocaine esterase-like n=1 Tax=Eurosta solidaginis TaxID=178769 RepID=UPI0035310A7B